MQVLPNHLRRRREKVFCAGPRVPLDREAQGRGMHLARVLKRKTELGKHYGALTGKFVDVLHALLWLIHDSRSGQCNPAYETIAEKAACARSTIWEAIKALESAGILSWVNRITRIRERDIDLFGRTIWVLKVVRTSNAYTFRDPKAPESRGFVSKSEFPAGPSDKVFNQPGSPPALDPDTPLGRALAAYGKTAGFTV